jgi:hypothetical protein
MPDWTHDQLILALEFYYQCPENMHTDSHAKCKEMADILDHTPGALDRVIRNIKYVDTGGTGLEHASQTIHALVLRFSGDQPGLKTEAAKIRAAHGWPDLNC